MTSFPNAPRLIKGGIVVLDTTTSTVQRVIALQYNPDTVTRSLQAQTVNISSGGSPNRSDALRLTGPPIETWQVEAELDATDGLEFPDQNPNVVQFGIHPALAALETLIYPSSAVLIQNNSLASGGTLEIAPIEAPLTLFVWSKERVLPVRLTEFSVTEEAFDPNLNPLRAKVKLGMRVLTVSDVGFNHPAGALSLVYHQRKEGLAARSNGGTLSALGLTGIP